MRVIRGSEEKSDEKTKGKGKRGGSRGKREEILMKDYISRKIVEFGG